MAEDQAAAYLAEVRERAGLVRTTGRSREAGTPYSLNVARRNSARDVPPLLAAVEVVLDLHKPGPAGIDPAYPDLRHCDRDDQPWPCYEYERVVAALLGEGKADG
jgi:hypothetical protein